MAGISIRSNTIQSTHIIVFEFSPSQSQNARLFNAKANPKNGLQRKVLADIKNVHQSTKSVSFDQPLKQSTKKPTNSNSKLFSTPLANKALKSRLFTTNTPSAAKTPNAKTPVPKSAIKFKIYDDSQPVTTTAKKKPTKKRNKHQEPEEIEYMLPTFGEQIEFKEPLPDYLHLYKPTTTLSMTSKLTNHNSPPSSPYVDHAFTDLAFSLVDYPPEIEIDLCDLQSSLSDEEDLLARIENDISFSLDAIDEELSPAGIDF